MNFIEFFKKFFRRFFNDSSIHGFNFIVRNELHFLEKFVFVPIIIWIFHEFDKRLILIYNNCHRLFWVLILLFSSFAAYLVFHGQFTRYRENPTVLSIELMPYGTFPRPSITICPVYSKNIYLKKYERLQNKYKWITQNGKRQNFLI